MTGSLIQISGNDGVGVTTSPMTFIWSTAAVTVGDILVIAFQTNNTTAQSVANITDNKGNTYTKITSQTYGPDSFSLFYDSEVWASTVTTGGAAGTITTSIAFTGSGGAYFSEAYDIQGFTTTGAVSAVGVGATSAGSGFALSTASLSPTTGSFVVGSLFAISSMNGTWVKGTGFTAIDFNGNNNAAESQVNWTSGSTTTPATTTIGTTGFGWIDIGVGFPLAPTGFTATGEIQSGVASTVKVSQIVKGEIGDTIAGKAIINEKVAKGIGNAISGVTKIPHQVSKGEIGSALSKASIVSQTISGEIGSGESGLTQSGAFASSPISRISMSAQAITSDSVSGRIGDSLSESAILGQKVVGNIGDAVHGTVVTKDVVTGHIGSGEEGVTSNPSGTTARGSSGITFAPKVITSTKASGFISDSTSEGVITHEKILKEFGLTASNATGSLVSADGRIGNSLSARIFTNSDKIVTDEAYLEDRVSVVRLPTIVPTNAFGLTNQEQDYIVYSYRQMIDIVGQLVTYKIQNIIGDDEYEHPIITYTPITVQAVITDMANEPYEYVETGFQPVHYANMWTYNAQPQIGDHVVWQDIEWEVRNSFPKVIGSQTIYYRTVLRRVLSTGTLLSGGTQPVLSDE